MYHFPFMTYRRYFLGLSAALLIITVISLVVQGLNFGIDFTGGMILDLKFQKQTTVAEVKTVFAQQGIKEADVRSVGTGGDEFIINTAALDQALQDKLFLALKDKFGAVTEISKDQVSPVISQELRRTALWAVGLATLGMILYLTVRFEWRFAIAAVLAMLHDILLTVGLFSVFRLPVESSFVAAVLTVYGYSMNDTIIVFDRIRERLKIRRKETLPELIDTSINQTLSRTINTVATVLLALLAVYILGGASTRVLALALLVGVTFGTYSSIFIASPIYLYFAEHKRRNLGAQRAA